jgi:hypothetical protein
MRAAAIAVLLDESQSESKELYEAIERETLYLACATQKRARIHVHQV